MRSLQGKAGKKHGTIKKMAFNFSFQQAQGAVPTSTGSVANTQQDDGIFSSLPRRKIVSVAAASSPKRQQQPLGTPHTYKHHCDSVLSFMGSAWAYLFLEPKGPPHPPVFHS